MNKELTRNQPSWDSPIICTILITILLPIEGLCLLFFMIWGMIWLLGRFYNIPILTPIVEFILRILVPIVLSSYLIG